METQLLNKVRELNNQKLYSSAVSMAGMLVTSCYQSFLKEQSKNTFNKSLSPSSFFMESCSSISLLASNVLACSSVSVDEYLYLCSILCEYGIALRNTDEPFRAKLYLSQSLAILQHLLTNNAKNQNILGKMYEVLELLGLCCLDSEDATSAMTHFEAIPQEYRSINVNMKMGEIYEKKGATPEAIQSFHRVLKMNSYALAVISHLIDLSGSQVNEIKQLYTNPNGNPFDKWIHCYVDATYARKHHKYKVALTLYETMNQTFPNNPEVLASIAECRARILDIQNAKDLFEKARKVDEHVTCEIASYGLLLRKMNELDELQRLAYNMMKTNRNSPETWATLCVYYESKGQNDKALKFAQKSIDLNDRYVVGYLLKANILAMMSRFSEAVTCYHTVHYFSRDIRIYQGLVNCYMAIPQLHDAKSAATMAQKLHPNHFKSAILLGNVLNMKSETRELARAQYQKAMQICQKEDEITRQIGLEESLLGLVEVEARNNNFKKAIQLVREQLEKHNSDTLHAKLGELYMKSGSNTEAMVHYHNALSLNPRNEQVRRALEELEMLLQPQEAEEEEEEEDGDGAFLDDDDQFL